jgi:hypothetical protein
VIMDPEKPVPETLKPLTFSELGVKERKDLEEWVKANPDILGAELLIITTEYDRFDKSDKRLDILALDEDGKLVVVELKRDAAGSLADLQALRYAAFCSQMTLPEIVKLRAEHTHGSVDKAEQDIQGFVRQQPFTKLDNKPRIILAAGSFDDQELTSCVMWLRSFKVDITCVEVTPYRAPKDNTLILVPRILIPLPEAEDYIVGIENKEASQSDLSPLELRNRERNGQILKYFRELMPEKAPQKAWIKPYMQIPTGRGGIHFEWRHHGGREKRFLDVALHCETSSRKQNHKICNLLRNKKKQIRSAVGETPKFQPNWGEKWSSVYYRESPKEWTDALARRSAERMRKFIMVVQPLVDEFYGKD